MSVPGGWQGLGVYERLPWCRCREGAPGRLQGLCCERGTAGAAVAFRAAASLHPVLAAQLVDQAALPRLLLLSTLLLLAPWSWQTREEGRATRSLLVLLQLLAHLALLLLVLDLLLLLMKGLLLHKPLLFKLLLLKLPLLLLNLLLLEVLLIQLLLLVLPLFFNLFLLVILLLLMMIMLL